MYVVRRDGRAKPKEVGSYVCKAKEHEWYIKFEGKTEGD